MKLIGQTKITTVEEPDRLQFILTREHGWLDVVAGPILLTGFAVYSFIAQSWWFLFFCGIGFVYMVATYLNGPVTTLFVSDEGIEASGNLGRAFITHARIEADRVETLGYFGGSGEDGTPGLYVNRTELLAKLNEREADSISFAVRKRFPLLERGDQSSTSLLHGEDSGITTLGLSSRSPER